MNAAAVAHFSGATNATNPSSDPADADRRLREQMLDELRMNGRLQFLVEVLSRMFEHRFSLFDPERFWIRFRAEIIMSWLKKRPDLRARLASALTGLHIGTARYVPHQDQASLIEASFVAGDCNSQKYVGHLAVDALVVHGDPRQIWSAVVDGLGDEGVGDDERRVMFAFVLERLLATESMCASDSSRQPIMRAADLFMLLKGRPWREHVPAKLLDELDESLTCHMFYTPDVPFTAERRLEIVTVEVIAREFSYDLLMCIVHKAGESMGFETAEQSEPATIPPPAEPEVEAVPAAAGGESPDAPAASLTDGSPSQAALVSLEASASGGASQAGGGGAVLELELSVVEEGGKGPGK